MANWIKAIYFVVILAWVIYVLSDDAVKYKSFPRRFGLSVALTVIIGLAGFALWHAAVPTSIKLLSEDSEVAESHSLASLKTGSHLDGKVALSFGYLTEQDEYVVMMRQDDGGYRRKSYPADGTVVYEDAEADDARVEVVDQYVVIRETHEFPRFLFTYAPADGSDEVVKSVRGRRSEIVASFNEWYAEQEKVHEESPKCPAKVSCGHEADSVSSDAKEENSVMSGKERNDTENKINSTDETVFSIMANGPESSKPIMAFRSREDAAYFLECLQQASGIMGGDTTYSIVDLILKN